MAPSTQMAMYSFSKRDQSLNHLFLVLPCLSHNFFQRDRSSLYFMMKKFQYVLEQGTVRWPQSPKGSTNRDNRQSSPAVEAWCIEELQGLWTLDEISGWYLRPGLFLFLTTLDYTSHCPRPPEWLPQILMWDEEHYNFTLSEFLRSEANVLFWSPQPKSPFLLCLWHCPQHRIFVLTPSSLAWKSKQSPHPPGSIPTRKFLLPSHSHRASHTTLPPLAFFPTCSGSHCSPSPSSQENLWLHLCACSFSSESSYLSSTLRAHWLRPQFRKEFYHMLKCGWLSPSIYF